MWWNGWKLFTSIILWIITLVLLMNIVISHIVTSTNNNGPTPPHLASANGHTSVAEYQRTCGEAAAGNQPSGQSVESHSINALELSARKKICKTLNTKIASGDDFRKLAEHAGMSKDHVELVCEERNPTDLVLSWWAQQTEGTISNLRRTLLLMGRLGCVRILDKGRKSGHDSRKRLRFEEEADYTEIKKQRLDKATHECDQPSTSRASVQGEKRKKDLGALDPVIYRKLCDELNQSLDGKDYLTLASKMRYGIDDVKSFEKTGNATDAMLTHWKTKSKNSLHKLIKFLRKMDREDLVKSLRKAREESSDSSSDEEGPRKTRQVGELDPVTYRKLCDELNQRLNGKDYLTLASKMRCGIDEVKSFEKSGNATDAMLTHWKTKSKSSLPKLMKFLKKMDREDLIKSLRKAQEESSDSSSNEE